MPLKNDNDILTNKLKKCLKTGDFSDLDCLFNGRIDVARTLVSRYSQLFHETAIRTQADGSVLEETFVDYRKWSLPAVLEVLKRAGRRQLGL